MCKAFGGSVGVGYEWGVSIFTCSAMIAISLGKPKAARTLFTPGLLSQNQIARARANLVMGILEIRFAKSVYAGEGKKSLSQKIEEAIRADGDSKLLSKALDAPLEVGT